MIERESIPLPERKSWLARILIVLSIIVVVIYGRVKNKDVLVSIYLSVLGIVLTPVLRRFCIFLEELYGTWTWTWENVLNSFKRSFSGTVWKPIFAVIIIDGIALLNRFSSDPELDVISIISGICVSPLVAYLLKLNAQTDHAESYGGDSATHKLETYSSILEGEIELIIQLQKWVGVMCKWDLCYRASRDGWSADNFHRHCDNKGPTVVLVKANDCIFGGYTDQNWDSSRRYTWKSSNVSFLFSLRNKGNLAPFFAKIEQGKEQNAIYCYAGDGPTFGFGHDLYICNNPQVNNQSYSNFGETYQLPENYVDEYDSELLAGQTYFQTTEIEVFN